MPTTSVVNPNGASPWYQNYVDLQADVKPWMQIPATYTTQDANLQLLVDMTCTWAQRKLAQPLCPTTFTRRFNGWSSWNGAYIELPYYPILAIDQCVEYRGVAGAYVLSESTPTAQVDGFQCDPHTGLLIRVFPGLVQKPWFPGSRNIEVTWTAGYNPTPADWKVATLEMIAHWFRNVFQQSANHLQGTGTGNEYDPEEVANGLWQGTPLRIIDLLDAGLEVGIA